MGGRIAGVVFDLFGTLVPRYPIDRHRKVLAEIAALLGVDPVRFTEVWISRLERRITGFCRDAEECILDTLEAMGASADREALARAAAIRYEFMRSCVVPYPEVEEGIRALKGMGYKLGLISNSSPEVPELWRSLSLSRYFDVATFSCEVRTRKPHREIYLMTCSALVLSPELCLYVGDGSENELEGAREVGMFPVMIVRDGPLRDWDGPVVRDVMGVVELLKSMSDC
ncbi:MAG: HAD family hydrolase [Nitrososphaerota archaeon]